MIRTSLSLILMSCSLAAGLKVTPVHAKDGTPSPLAKKLPRVPDGFEISVFASEPLIYKPTAICFDAQGRAMVGQGPQYHLSESIKESDSVVLLLDTDGDGDADRRKVFATGFNSIQGLAWKGRDLYVANSPELTVVRDLDGDDVADEYVVVYTDLGNHEHALHGLVWGPDGRLYMSKGNSKGHNQPEKFGRVAPKAFRELWDVEHPEGALDIPPAQTFTVADYRSTYHDPHDDWGREGGVLRCDPLGGNLEIVSRGMRNPWDIAIDGGFNLLGTDNDQTQGDRIIMPFFGAHFGWGHRYSSHWTGKGNLPTVPVSGPMTSGSWAGIVYYDHEHFPPAYRDVFLINDWMFGTYVYRPGWNGALRAADGSLEPFIQRSESGMIYRPTDIAVGPDGAIYALGWGSNYHYEPGSDGSWVFRVSHREAQRHGSREISDARSPTSLATPLAECSVAQLLNALKPGVIPAKRVNAQDELVRRGAANGDELMKAIAAGELSTGQQTWVAWGLGRMNELGKTEQEAIRKWSVPPARSQKVQGTQSATARVPRNLRIQAIRILAFRARRFGESDAALVAATTAMADPDPRVRFEAMQAVHQADLQLATDVLRQLAKETDRAVFYAGWQALRDLASVETRQSWLNHESSRVRLAALLGLQEDYALTQKEVLELVDHETDPLVQSWALTFAMNPLPPAKLSNDTLRIEMEQTLPIGQMIEQADKADSLALRRLYLQLIARASVREGEQQKQLLAFYRTLQSADERALILPAAATTRDALPDLWEAFGETQLLQNAAVAGIANLHRLHAKQLSSSESVVRSTSRSVSNVNDFAVEIAAQLLAEMSDAGSADPRIPGAVRALDSLPLPNGWSPSDAALNTLLAILESRKEPPTRRRALRLLGKLEQKSVVGSTRFAIVLTKLCEQPDALLYRDLLALKTVLGLEIEVPKPPVATVEDVLARLDQANVDRGRELFFDRVGGAGCVSCHRVRGRGSDIAPDLSGVGVRLTPENMIKSIIQPSAAITEGYAVQFFVTDDGRTHTGAVIRETSTTVTILRTDSSQVSLATESIDSRKRLKQSVMPSGYDLFGAEQLANLTAWLLTLRDGFAIVSEQE